MTSTMPRVWISGCGSWLRMVFRPVHREVPIHAGEGIGNTILPIREENVPDSAEPLLNAPNSLSDAPARSSDCCA